MSSDLDPNSQCRLEALANLGRVVLAEGLEHVVVEDQHTLLHSAAKRDCPWAVEVLLEPGLSDESSWNVDVTGDVGDTPLMVAASHNSMNAAALLLQKGANVNAVSEFCSNTALHLASWEALPDMTALLISAGADVNARAGCSEAVVGMNMMLEDDCHCTTPLHIAASRGLVPIMQQLIAANADINAQNHEGYTALMLALKAQQPPDVIRVLLEAGAVAKFAPPRVTIRQTEQWNVVVATTRAWIADRQQLQQLQAVGPGLQGLVVDAAREMSKLHAMLAASPAAATVATPAAAFAAAGAGAAAAAAEQTAAVVPREGAAAAAAAPVPAAAVMQAVLEAQPLQDGRQQGSRRAKRQR